VKRILTGAVLILICGTFFCFGEDPRDELYRELSTSLEQAEALVAEMVLQDEASVTGELLAELQSLDLQIQGSLYSDLIDRSDLLLTLTTEQMLFQRDPQQLQAQVEGLLLSSREQARNLRRSEVRDKVLRTCFNTTLISFASAFTLWGLGELQDRRYFQATTIEEGTLRRRLFQVFSIGSIVGAAVGAIGAGVSVTLYAGAR